MPRRKRITGRHCSSTRPSRRHTTISPSLSRSSDVPKKRQRRAGALIELLLDYVEALTNLGAILVDQGKTARMCCRCCSTLDRCVRAMPTFTTIWPRSAAWAAKRKRRLAIDAPSSCGRASSSASKPRQRAPQSGPVRGGGAKLSPHAGAAAQPAGDSNSLAQALAKLGRHAEAETAYRRLLKLQPTNWAALRSLGVCLWNLGRFEESETCHRRALELQPELRRGAVAISASPSGNWASWRKPRRVTGKRCSCCRTTRWPTIISLSCCWSGATSRMAGPNTSGAGTSTNATYPAIRLRAGMVPTLLERPSCCIRSKDSAIRSSSSATLRSSGCAERRSCSTVPVHW